MSASTMVLDHEQTPAGASISLPARLFVVGTVAGGVLLGGFLVGGMTAMGRLSGHAWLVNAMVLFVIGCALGAVPAVVLGVFGRPAEMDRHALERALLRGLLALVPTLGFAAILAGWIAMAKVALYLHSTPLLAGVALAWLLGLGLLTWATIDGALCLRNFRQRHAAH